VDSPVHSQAGVGTSAQRSAVDGRRAHDLSAVVGKGGYAELIGRDAEAGCARSTAASS
jgi:hypothetical protein